LIIDRLVGQTTVSESFTESGRRRALRLEGNVVGLLLLLAVKAIRSSTRTSRPSADREEVHVAALAVENIARAEG
jgi:hypothetical protein